MNLLLTGVAGYIGSVLATRLISAGHAVTVLDDLSTGHSEALPPGAELVRGDVRSSALGASDRRFDAVLHLAAKSLVTESVADPSRYWNQNLGGMVALLDAMRAAQIRRIVFSSTAAAYGEQECLPIAESAPPRPANAYGASKLAADVVLTEYAKLHGIAAVSLLKIHGTDYPTPDGTCMRDYVHVSDLAEAHLLALEACTPGRHLIYNLGSGVGFSNLDVLTACCRATGQTIAAELAPRRPGDPAILIASADRIRLDLGWRAERDLDAMTTDAWACLLSRSSGHPGQA